MIHVVNMAPLMMHHTYTSYGGGGSGNLQQMQGPPQQLHLQQHQLQPHWNNHTAQKRSKYQNQSNKKKKITIEIVSSAASKRTKKMKITKNSFSYCRSPFRSSSSKTKIKSTQFIESFLKLEEAKGREALTRLINSISI